MVGFYKSTPVRKRAKSKICINVGVYIHIHYFVNIDSLRMTYCEGPDELC
jgi:hypothetical protein